ncbi:MAG: hypothetical protein ACK5PG_18290 [Lysobacterales bacterium]
MQVTTAALFLVAMALIFSVPCLIWRLGRTEYYAPLVFSADHRGVLVGPGALGAAFPEYYGFVLKPEVIATLNGDA